MPLVSVVIPTRRRPASLRRAAASVLDQTGVEAARIELIIVDNDAEAGARDVAEAIAGQAPFPVRYLCEPRPGVASARNAAVAAAKGELIAFLDDDEEAPAGWLAALLAAQARFSADVVFGPVKARIPDAVRRHRAYLERFFSRIGPAAAQPLEHFYGCGDSLVRRAALPHPTAPFDVAHDQIGGEDDRLFQAMKAAGARFAWAPEAWVWEHPEPARLSLAYTLHRAFGYGQGPAFYCMQQSPPDRVGAARWMAVGLIQSMVFGAEAAIKWLTMRPDRAFALDRAAQGLGKVLWFGPFKGRYYGLAQG